MFEWNFSFLSQNVVQRMSCIAMMVCYADLHKNTSKICEKKNKIQKK